jgi:transcriptional regulator with XRE-family HTH domain
MTVMSDTPNNDYPVEPGLRLKMIRERLQLRYRDVEEGSTRIAEYFKNDELIVSLGRLSDIEHKGTVPNLYRLFSLCALYGLDGLEVMSWYGVDFRRLPLGPPFNGSQP